MSTSKKSRNEHLEQLKNEKRTMIFYEAPHKLSAALKDMYNAFGARRISIVRELTKIHEEVIRTDLKTAVEQYADGSVRGEIVLVIEGAADDDTESEITLEQAAEIALQYMEDGLSASESAKKTAKETGFKKNDIYRMIVDNT